MAIRWGILGLGKIAHHFAKDLALSEDNLLQGVASRSAERAKNFQEIYSAKTSYGSYSELCKAKDIDIVYIATPHDSHRKYAIMAMESGKAVLCEKPAAVNYTQLQEMLSLAKNKKIFFMEALWTRFNPVIQEIKRKIEGGVIGELTHLYADFSFYNTFDEQSRLFSPLRAGGALLDIGLYPVFLSYLLLGLPSDIYASSILHDNGIDLQTSMQFTYSKATSQLHCSLRSPTKVDATISGTEGEIILHPRWHETESYSVKKNGEINEFQIAKTGKGYYHEILECANCIKSGNTESPLWSHQDSENLIKLLDKVRKLTGIRYSYDH